MKRSLLLLLLFGTSMEAFAGLHNFIKTPLGKKIALTGTIVGGLSMGVGLPFVLMYFEKNTKVLENNIIIRLKKEGKQIVIGFLALGGLFFWCGISRSDLKNGLYNGLSELSNALSNIKNVDISYPKDTIKTLLIEPKFLGYSLSLLLAFAAYFRPSGKTALLASVGPVFLGVSAGILEDWRSKIKISI